MLSIRGLVKRYGERTILDGLSLVVEPGDSSHTSFVRSVIRSAMPAPIIGS